MKKEDQPDSILEALGAHVEMREVDAAWEEVARGERDLDELAELRLRAGDSPEQIERARALFQPLDDAELEGLLELVHTKEVAATDDRRRRRGLAGVIVLALAAAALLWWALPADSPAERERLAALPDYVLETPKGGLETVRGDADAPSHHYRSDTPFEWNLLPKDPVEGPIEVRMFAFPRHGVGRVVPTRELDERGEEGAFVLRGQASELGLEPGPWTIVIAVGRPSALPSDPSQARALESTSDRQVVSMEITIEE